MDGQQRVPLAATLMVHGAGALFHWILPPVCHFGGCLSLGRTAELATIRLIRLICLNGLWRC